MVRLILHLLKIRDYESCKSCETLKQQLEFVNSEKKELMETLLLITKPAVVVQSEPPKILNPLAQASGLFSRRRGILENMHKKREETVKTSPFIAKPDDMIQPQKRDITQESISALETRLGLADDGEKVNAS